MAPRDPTSTQTHIEVRGARQHSLKGVDLDLPRGHLVVFSGVSGSGKSSMAFDTLYAEGQRRYLESLNAYARQFLGQMEKPAVTAIRNLSPTIAIEQRGALKNPRSTVGTITEIQDHLRLLFARLGRQRCHVCGAAVEPRSAAEIVEILRRLPEGSRFVLLAPMGDRLEGDLAPTLKEIQRQGFTRVRLNSEHRRLEELEAGTPGGPHRLEVVVDRLILRPDIKSRLTDSVETTLKMGAGRLRVEVRGGEELAFAESDICQVCATPAPRLTPQLFSFNHPQGMCPTCNGLGVAHLPDLEKIVPDPSLSPLGGAVGPLGDVSKETRIHRQWLITLGEAYGFDPASPWRALPAKAKQVILHGTGDRALTVAFESERRTSELEVPFEGAIPMMMRRLRETSSEWARDAYLSFLTERICEACGGNRLRPEAAQVFLDQGLAEAVNLPSLLATPLGALAELMATLAPEGSEALIARDLLREIRSRLTFLLDVGVGYLSLDRAGPSLSGGEAQRIRLASQLGTELTGVLYVLDEPSIGLHPRDTGRLLKTLERLRDLGNTVLVVEHEEGVLRAADHIVDFGPGAGTHGGEILYSGPLPGLLTDPTSRTGGYLSGRLRLPIPQARRAPGPRSLTVRGARANNLKDVTARLPLGCFIAVTGVSGAGKSSLINHILAPALAHALHGAQGPIGAHDAIEGLTAIDKVIRVDQSPIGSSPRSNPATYTKAFDELRKIFAGTQEARMRGFTASRFSFNAKGGRCEVCQGQGSRKVEMQFLADVYVPCDVCEGRRFNDATLAVTFKGHSIADILEMSVEEAYVLLRNHPKLSTILGVLRDVGLGYIGLGQPANTLSGGEAQRMKLARELARPRKGHTLYLLDEPTTGLHYDDVARLLQILQQLVDEGSTVLVVEHDLGMIAAADWVVDMGPEGGSEGGRIVAEGSPEAVAATPGSHTGEALRAFLAARS